MCSFAVHAKGKHMFACSFVNRLQRRMPQQPDVMDKCQRNTLAPLGELAQRRNLLGVSLWRKQNPKPE